jgi:hypothetical protein
MKYYTAAGLVPCLACHPAGRLFSSTGKKEQITNISIPPNLTTRFIE